MSISLELLSNANKSEIYEFELVNRAYFELLLASRDHKYYAIETYEQITETLLDEQSRGECYLYVIRDQQGKVIGRINYSSIKEGEKRSAEIGYRIAESEQRKGYGSMALKLALEMGFSEHKFMRIEAGTAPENIASQRVLEKNGFKYVAKYENVMMINGKWSDGLLYELEKEYWMSTNK